MEPEKKKKTSGIDWLVRIVVIICILLFIAGAIFVVPRISTKEATADTYYFHNFEYPAFYRVVKKQWFTINMFRNDEYRQYLYIGNYSDEEVETYVDYLENSAGYTMFPNLESRWHYDVSAGHWDDNGEARYINIVLYKTNSAVYITLW